MATIGFDSLPQAAFLQLWRTYDRLKALEEELFARHRLSAQQYNALRLLQAAHPKPIPTLTLGAKLISRAPDMTRMLDKLQRQRLVRRHRLLENRRVVVVGITRQGLRLLKVLAAPLRACHRRQLGHMNAASLRRLIELLKAARAPHENGVRPTATNG